MEMLSILAALVILIPLALGVQLIAFLHEYMLPVFSIFWGLIIIIFFILAGKKEKNKHDKWGLTFMWACLLPISHFLVGAIEEIVESRGFAMVIGVLIELPLGAMFCLGVGLCICLLADKIKNPLGMSAFMIGGNVLFTLFLALNGI